MPRFLLLILLAALSTASAHAQDLEKDAAKPAREKAQTGAAQAAAAQSQDLSLEQDVTYEQVLAAPDDIKLNFRFARTQVRKGEVKGAAATLERILMVAPKEHEVRLFYAIVLYRLDNVVEAERELNALKSLPLPPVLLQEADKYLKAVRKRMKNTLLSGSLGLAFEYDTNRNASPATGRRLFGGTPALLTGSSRRRDDTSAVFMGDVGVRRKLPYQAGHELFGDLSYYQAEQTLTKNLNLKAYSVKAGGVWKAVRLDLTPALLYDHVQLAQSTFLRNRGASLRADYRLSAGNRLFLEAQDVYQDYVRTRQVPTAVERTGMQLDFTAGSEHVLGPTMKFGTVAGYTLKHAQKRYNAFDRYVAGINHAWLLGQGAFLASSFLVNYDLYDQPDPAVSQSLRKDTTMRADVVLGAPLSLVHKSLQDLLFTFNYEYYHALSSLENYAYSNNKVAGMLTYRWEVGL